MNIWYLISAPAFVLLIITATARLADLGREDWAPLDHAHRIGLIAVAVALNALLFAPFSTDHATYLELGWRTALLAWGLLIVWITKRGLIPWWDFVLGVHRKTDDWRGLGFRARMRGEARALRDSFRPHRYRKPLAGPKGPLP